MVDSRHIRRRLEPIPLEDYWRGEEVPFNYRTSAVKEEMAFGDGVFQAFQAAVLQSPVTTSPEERAVFELIHVATRHFGAALTLAARGHTSEVLCLMRSVIEGADDARRLREKPELASVWLNGPDGFRAAAKRLRVSRFRNGTEHLRDYYDLYSTHGSHPNVGPAQSLYEIQDPLGPRLSFRTGDPGTLHLFLLSCGLSGHQAVTAVMRSLWPNVRPPEILTREAHLDRLRQVVAARWIALRRAERLVSL